MGDDRRFGACPSCGGRKFADTVELWAEKVAWAMLVVVLAYLASPFIFV